MGGKCIKGGKKFFLNLLIDALNLCSIQEIYKKDAKSTANGVIDEITIERDAISKKIKLRMRKVNSIILSRGKL